MNIDKEYAELLRIVLVLGDKLETRNHGCYSYHKGLSVNFGRFPLITARKTSWKYAITEMEWFLSGNSKCPEKIVKWWKGQLNKYGSYLCGYGAQLKAYTSANKERDTNVDYFDQIEHIIESLKNHPNSRRLITTTWHPEEMSRITEINDNPNTPTTCHGTVTQYFVRKGKLYLNTYQRSADMLLGVPHNWVQYWAYLMWLAHRTGYKVGGITWMFGDAHIYDDASHTDTAREIIANVLYDDKDFTNHFCDLVYTPTSKEFKANDFSIIGTIPEPVVLGKPKLF